MVFMTGILRLKILFLYWTIAIWTHYAQRFLHFHRPSFSITLHITLCVGGGLGAIQETTGSQYGDSCWSSATRKVSNGMLRQMPIDRELYWRGFLISSSHMSHLSIQAGHYTVRSDIWQWWSHDMETFSSLLTLYETNPSTSNGGIWCFLAFSLNKLLDTAQLPVIGGIMALVRRHCDVESVIRMFINLLYPWKKQSICILDHLLKNCLGNRQYSISWLMEIIVTIRSGYVIISTKLCTKLLYFCIQIWSINWRQ